MRRFRPRYDATQSTDRHPVFVFALHERNSSMMVAGCVFVVKSYSFHAACWICCLTYCRRRNAENWALCLHALWREGGGLHQRNSSISELVSSSMPFIGSLFALHQRNSSIAELVISSMPLIGYLHYISTTVPSLNLCRHQASIATGLVNCTVFRQDTPLKVLRFLKRKHHCFHGGTGTNHFLRSPCRGA